MRLYGAIQKIEAQDDGTVYVHGIATSEAVDDQGEIVRADAIRAAIPEYMRFPALREMHQLLAAGTTLEAEVCDDGTTRIVAHVVDPVAVSKVKNQVYRGFSIGGRVTQRQAGNPKAITGLVLNEISLVDRPANPEAVFDCWKATACAEAPIHRTGDPEPGIEPIPPIQEPFNSPIQIWACGLSGHRHLAKADACKCLEGRSAKASAASPERGNSKAPRITGPKTEARTGNGDDATDSSTPDSGVRFADPAYLNGKEHYPSAADGRTVAAANNITKRDNPQRCTDDQLKRIRGAIVAGWKEKVDMDPHSADDDKKASQGALTKVLWDLCRIVRLIMDLEWLRGTLDLEVASESDASPPPARLQSIITELYDFLEPLVTDGTAELMADADKGGLPFADAFPEMLFMAAGASGPARTAALLKKDRPCTRTIVAALLAKAMHSRGDQALLNMAYFACDKCLQMGGLLTKERENLGKARDCLQRAGAFSIPASAEESAEHEPLLSDSEVAVAGSRGVDILEVLDAIAAVLGKRERAHQQLMDIAYECLSKLTDGAICVNAMKFGAWHSRETMEYLRTAHGYLLAAGATCDQRPDPGSNEVNEEHWPAETDPQKAANLEDLRKTPIAERAEKAALITVVTEIVPMLERLTKRVDEIARTPLPPLTMAKSVVSISKQQDQANSVRSGDPDLSPEAIASALAKMTKEEQTLTLIKASYANPIQIAGSTATDP
jgi:hypothetical protein